MNLWSFVRTVSLPTVSLPTGSLSTIPKATVCVLCWSWVVGLGTVLVAWNVHAGYTGRAKIVGLLMLFGATVYVADMLSSVLRGDRQSS